MSNFIKHDLGKPDFSLIDPYWHEDVAQVLTFGAKKYKRNNWQKNTDKNRTIAALERHLNAIKKGELIDPETNMQHTAHIACNSMFLHYMIHREMLVQRFKNNEAL